MAGDSGTETGISQVGGGPRAVDKLGTRVAGKAEDSYTTIRDRL